VLGLGWVVSYPESTDLDEFWDEVATDMEGDEGFKATDAGAAYESCRSGGLRKRKSRDLVVIQFDDGGMNTDGG